MGHLGGVLEIVVVSPGGFGVSEIWDGEVAYIIGKLGQLFLFH